VPGCPQARDTEPQGLRTRTEADRGLDSRARVGVAQGLRKLRVLGPGGERGSAPFFPLVPRRVFIVET